jgi:hypothetical protein
MMWCNDNPHVCMKSHVFSENCNNMCCLTLQSDRATRPREEDFYYDIKYVIADIIRHSPH